MSYRVTEQELKDFTKAMNEWQEKQDKKKERFERMLNCINHKHNKNKREFKIVSDRFRKNPLSDIQLPQRATEKSACYDFYSPCNYIVKPNCVAKIWTDVKANMNDDNVLLLQIRSSMGGKWELNNIQGIIDADYFENENNDGNIGIFLKNITDQELEIHKGDRIAQGMFCNYLTTNNDSSISNARIGGFGSSGK